MGIDTGGQAFPAIGRYVDKDTFETFTQGGMTLRDWFAGKLARQAEELMDNRPVGELSNYIGLSDYKQWDSAQHWPAVIAKKAYELADAMIAQRKREVP